MWRGSLRVLPILGVSLLAMAGGMAFSVAAMKYPHASGVIPAALACLAVGMLGSAVMGVVGRLGRRIQELERRLEDHTRRDAEHQHGGQRC